MAGIAGGTTDGQNGTIIGPGEGGRESQDHP